MSAAAPGHASPGPAALGSGSEFDLIRTMLGSRGTVSREVRVGPGDDCAILEGGVALSSDLVVEDIHFRRAWLSPAELGWRAVMAGLSDLAAVAARPAAVLLSLGLPRGGDGGAVEGWDEAPEHLARRIHDGAAEAAATLDVEIAGGDVTASPGPLVLDVLSVGRTDAPLLRSGARPGDEVWVTGTLGGAAEAVARLLDGSVPPDPLRAAFARPIARTREALWLVERGPIHAAVDLSDGLAGDAVHVGVASGASVVLERDLLPVAEGVAEISTALHGGEDYELCLVAPPGGLGALMEPFERLFGVSLTRVGRVEEKGEHPLLLEGPDGRRSAPERGGFDHFGRTGEAGGTG